MTEQFKHTFTQVSAEQSEILDQLVALNKRLIQTYDKESLTREDLRQMYASSLGTASAFLYAMAQLGVDIEPVKAAYLADLSLNFDMVSANMSTSH